MYEGALSVMKGYDIFVSGSNITATYTGVGSNLNTGSFSMNVYRTDPANGEIESHKGWNLLGNPYPSPVDWQNEAGWNKTGINNAKYIWNPSASNYTIWLGGNDPIGLNGGTQYIPAAQGFWVQATQNGSISINNTSRVGIATSTPGYYKNSISYPLIKLETIANNYHDECIIRFLKSADNAFNLHKDASKLIVPH